MERLSSSFNILLIKLKGRLLRNVLILGAHNALLCLNFMTLCEWIRRLLKKLDVTLASRPDRDLYGDLAFPFEWSLN